MTPSVTTEIEAYEERLTSAMLQSDVAALDELLAPELIFTNHLGQLMSKQDDLQAHRSGVVEIDDIAHFDRRIQPYDAMAIVAVRSRIEGRFAGVAAVNEIRFTRVWRRTPAGAWQVVAAHAGLVA